MRHSYEPDLDQLSTPEKTLEYLSAKSGDKPGSSEKQIAQLKKTIAMVAQYSVVQRQGMA